MECLVLILNCCRPGAGVIWLRARAMCLALAMWEVGLKGKFPYFLWALGMGKSNTSSYWYWRQAGCWFPRYFLYFENMK